MINQVSPRTVRAFEVTSPPPPELIAAYRLCRRMQRRHDPTYYWATRRLPKPVRPAVHALYRFVRGADEIVDGPRRPPTAEARGAGRVGGRARARHRRRALRPPGDRGARGRRRPP